MKSFAKIICTLLASLMLFSPLLANAQATDTSGGAAVTANGAAAANGNGNAAANAANAAQNQVQQNGKLTSCAFYSITCWLQTGVQWVAALFVSIAVWIMIFNGWLFDLAISETVLGFNGWVQGDVLTAITTGWTFFRDIANIVIIGLFVFIAICIILGVKSYGQRSLIARVLIVAVLLNFSFLFTRIVINFSNALATQFAKVQPLNASAANVGTKPADISGKFTDLMGVKSITETKDTLALISQNSNSTWLMLLHALFFIFLSLGVAIVLLYGTILLIIRAIIFIFLLVTSSLAFSTYLLPSLASSDFGWKAWWTALFRNALLAPILMLFLAIALQVSTGLKVALVGGQNGGATGGSLGALAAHPNDPQNMSAFMIYIIILGLLYGTIRISNRFAGAAGQMAWAGTLPFANATVAWPSRSLGFLGRNTIGRGAQRLSENFSSKAKMEDGVQRGIISRWALNQGAQAGAKVAKADFNPGNATGIKSAQTKIGGYTGQEKARTDKLKNQALQMTMDDKKVKELLAKNRQTAAEETSAEKTTKQTEMEGAKALKEAAEATRKAAEEQKQNIDKDINNLANKIKEVKDKGGSITEKEKLDLASDEEKLARKRIDSEAQSRIIEKAKNDAQTHTNQTDAAKAAITALEKRAEERARDMMPKGMLKPGTDKVIPKGERAAVTAQELGHERIANIIPKMSGLNDINTDAFANRVRNAVSKDTHHDEQNKAIKDAVKEFTRQLEHTGEHIEHAAEHAHEDANKQSDILKDIKHNTSH